MINKLLETLKERKRQLEDISERYPSLVDDGRIYELQRTISTIKEMIKKDGK